MSFSTHFQAFWSVGPFSEQYFTNVTSPLSSSSTGISSSVSDIQQRRSRPILPPFETEILVKDNVSLLDLKDQKTDYKNGTIVLTSHRILWYCTQSNRFLYSKVEDVKQIRILLADPEMTVGAVAKRFNVSRMTIYRYTTKS